MTFTIKSAQPINNRLLMAIAGPQASGKTTSALRLATGITQATGGKICFIDTENKRALRYAGAFKFNHLELDPAFSPERYDEAIQYAHSQGYGEGDVIIIDSMSHEHDGPGGVLEMHEEWIDKRLAANNKNVNDYRERDKYNMLAWNHAKKGRKRLISYTLQRTKCHVILCFRAKEKVEQVKVNGKTEYVNNGLSPIGADEYFYEMDISFILPLGAMGKPDWNEKSSRINEYGERMPITDLLKSTQQISEDTGKRLSQISQAAPPPETAEDKTKKAAQAMINQFRSIKDPDELYVALEGSKEKMGDIKSVSQAAYDYVMAEYEKHHNTLINQ